MGKRYNLYIYAYIHKLNININKLKDSHLHYISGKCKPKHFSSIRWHYFSNCILFILLLCFVSLGLCCCMWVFSSCREQGLLSSCSVWASHCSGFSCETPALGAQASVVVKHGLSCCGLQALEHAGFSSCGFQALKHGLRSCDTWA